MIVDSDVYKISLIIIDLYGYPQFLDIVDKSWWINDHEIGMWIMVGKAGGKGSHFNNTRREII